VKIFRYGVSCLLFIGLLSCAKKQTVEIITSPEQEFSRAMDLLIAKKYINAVEAFQNLVFNYPGSTYGADAQFYLAETYFRKKDYQSAIPEFEFFINSFPGNQHLEEAYYKYALSYFNLAPSVAKDQSMLAKTIEILTGLQEKFPETKYSAEITDLGKKVAERYAEKNYDIGKLYYDGGEYLSARTYLDNVILEYPETKWANWSKYLIGQICEKTDSIPQAINLYQSLVADSTDTELRNLAQDRLQQLAPKQ
jgi:outer membrane protein assembly factor BamD